MNILTFLLAGFLSMQAGTASEWKDKGPTDTGWRSARPGMTLDEVLAAFPGQAKREKEEKADSGAKLPVVKFKEKVRIDGAEYEVSFHFSSEGKLVSIQFTDAEQSPLECFNDDGQRIEQHPAAVLLGHL